MVEMNLFAGQRHRCRGRPWTHGELGRGKERLAGTESNINVHTFTTVYKTASGKLIYNTGA